LFRYGQGVINLDAEIPDGALNLGMAEQQLHGAQIAGSAVDQRLVAAWILSASLCSRGSVLAPLLYCLPLSSSSVTEENSLPSAP
jgi:hypothetical protein